MIPCDYCEGYATTCFCSKCGYSSALYADLTGQYEYVPSMTDDEAKAEAERIAKELKIGQEYMDPPTEEEIELNKRLFKELEDKAEVINGN